MSTNKNKRYIKGANLEREIKKSFETMGFLGCRSAGSKGKFDVWLSNGQFLLFGQAKKGMEGKSAEKLLVELTKFVTEKFPRITIPIVVAVFNGVKDGAAIGASKILIPQKAGDKTEIKELSDAIASKEKAV